MLVVLAAPALNACNGDGRGLLGCVRGLVDDKFDLGIGPGATATGPVVIEAPAPSAPPVDLQVAEAPVEPPGPLAAPAAEEPTAPPVSQPPVPRVEPELPADAPLPPVAPPEPVAAPEPAAAAAPAEPVAEPAGALAFVPGDPAPVEAAPAPAKPVLEQEPVMPAVEAVEPPVADTEPVVAPETEQPVEAPSADPAPTPPSFMPAAPADFTVAAIDPVVPADPQPLVPVLAPTIDAIEIDGDDNFIAGNGPAGATMRLYVDGIPVGVSPVEGGRWLVEGPDLLTDEQQVLKVEALDPLTGRVLGGATIAFEGPLGTEAASAPEAPVTIDRPDEDEPPAAAETMAAEEPDAAPVVVEAPVAVPPIRPVAPVRESPSVTILKPSGNPVFETLPSIGETSSGSIVTLGKADLTPHVEPGEADVPVLRAVAIGDPGAGRFVSGKAIIRRGDTLWDIAHRFYGRGIHYRTIFRANRELIARPGRIYPGQVFELPLVYDD